LLLVRAAECFNLCDLLLFCVSASVGHAMSARRIKVVAALAECIESPFRYWISL
jgi:hypothetical protein